MARVDISSRLSSQIKDALAEEERIAASVAAAVGAKPAADDVAGQRRLYNANRAFWNEGGPAMADRVDLTIDGPGGDLPLRIHYPVDDRPLPALIFLHGGGWVLGNLDTHDRIMRQLAADSGMAVVGVDYRLAPEAPFPCANEDAAVAVHWLAENGADLGLDVDRLAIGGDSAGAALSLGTLHIFKEERPNLLKAGLLYYGAYGLRDSRSRRLFGGEEDGLSAENLAFFRDCLMAPGAAKPDWRLNLLSRDVAGMPPLFIGPVECDPLRDDSDALSELCVDAGIPHDYHLFKGVLHGFLHMSRMVDASREALALGGAFLRRHVAGA